MSGIEGVWARDPVTGEWDPERPRDPPRRTLCDRIRRWWRGDRAGIEPDRD